MFSKKDEGGLFPLITWGSNFLFFSAAKNAPVWASFMLGTKSVYCRVAMERHSIDTMMMTPDGTKKKDFPDVCEC